MFISGVPAVKQASDAFSMFDGGQKAEHGLEFGDQTFGSARNSIKFLGRDQNQSGKNKRKSRLMTGVVIFFSGNEGAHLLHPAQAGGSRGSEQQPGVARVEESAPVQREEGDWPVQPLGHRGGDQGGDSQGNRFLNTYSV